jgi:hypothetical protein
MKELLLKAAMMNFTVDDEDRSIEEDGTIVIKMGRLYEVSFVKEPLHPAWRVELVQRVEPPELMFTEYSANDIKGVQDAYDLKAWRKANDAYFKKLFDRPYNRGSTVGDPFRKQSVKEVQEELHKLLNTIFTNPEDHKQEYEGHWNGEW